MSARLVQDNSNAYHIRTISGKPLPILLIYINTAPKVEAKKIPRIDA